MIARAAFVVGVDTGPVASRRGARRAAGGDLRRHRTRTARAARGGQDRDRRRARRTCRRSRKSAPPWSALRPRRQAPARACAARSPAPARPKCRACSGDGRTRQVGLWHGWQSSLLDGLLHGGGDRIERRPMPRAGRPENADRRRAERGRDVHAGPKSFEIATFGCRERQDRVAQVGAGEIARERARHRAMICVASGFSAGPPMTQTSHALRDQRRASSANDAPGQRFDGPTAPGASATTRRARQPEPLAPAGDLGGRHAQLGQRPFGSRLRRVWRAAPARRIGRPCAGACARPSADR